MNRQTARYLEKELDRYTHEKKKPDDKTSRGTGRDQNDESGQEQEENGKKKIKSGEIADINTDKGGKRGVISGRLLWR